MFVLLLTRVNAGILVVLGYRNRIRAEYQDLRNLGIENVRDCSFHQKVLSDNKQKPFRSFLVFVLWGSGQMQLKS